MRLFVVIAALMLLFVLPGCGPFANNPAAPATPIGRVSLAAPATTRVARERSLSVSRTIGDASAAPPAQATVAAPATVPPTATSTPDVPVPTATSTPPPVAPTPRPPGPPLGRFDAVTKARLRAIWQAGQARGRRPNVLAKVGDSITASGSFLADVGDGRAVLGNHRELAPIIAYYRAARVDRSEGRAHNSLNRRSLAAKAGWMGSDILGIHPGRPVVKPSPLQQEYGAINPSVALIMFGTNDIDQTGVDFFSSNLTAIVHTSIDAGIIPVLSTIPDRMDYPQAAYRTAPFNDAIRDLAAQEHLPLIEYWAAMRQLPNNGLGSDMVHPSIYPGHGSVTFTAKGLRYGWNLRNFLTLQMLARLKAVVIDNGLPEP
jgi:hypothetical protein